MTRSKKLFDRVRFNIGQRGDIPDELIYAVITDASRRIAEETLCIEGTDTFASVASQVEYDEPTGFYRMKHIVAPSGTTIIPKEIDRIEYDHLLKVSPNITTANALLFYRWGGKLGFYPTFTSAATYTVLFYAIPSADLSESLDPETPSYTDDGITYWTLTHLHEIFGDLEKALYYRNAYEREVQRILSSQRRTKSQSLDVYYHDV